MQSDVLSQYSVCCFLIFVVRSLTGWNMAVRVFWEWGCIFASLLSPARVFLLQSQIQNPKKTAKKNKIACAYKAYFFSNNSFRTYTKNEVKKGINYA